MFFENKFVVFNKPICGHGDTSDDEQVGPPEADAAVPVAGSPECGGRQFVVAGSNGSDQGHGARVDTVFEGPPGVSRWSPGVAQLPYMKPIGSHRDLSFDKEFVVCGHGDTSDDETWV